MYTIGASAAYVLAVVLFGYAMARHPWDRLADTGSPVVPPTSFFWLQVAVFAGLGYYVYRLWTWPHNCHVLFFRLPVGATLALKGVGWALWAHGNMTGATVCMALGAAWITAVMLWFMRESERFVCSDLVAIEHTTPYKPPGPTVYCASVAPALTLVGWMWVLFYLVLVAVLTDSGQIASPTAASNILFIIVAVTVFPVAQFHHAVHIPMVWWVSLVFIAGAVKATPHAAVLHATVWASIGLMAGLFFYGLHARFLTFRRFYVGQECEHI